MKSKRILSLLLVLGMLASMLPSALAADVSDFTDVSESDWYYEYVDYVAEKGYFQGTSATTFSPAVTMTRAMFVTAVSRVAGETGDAGTAPFDDVPAGTWYTAAVDWATEHGVINGVGGNKFAPEREITREEMCVIMARFIAYLEESQKKTFKKDADPIDFPDADQIADYAKEAVDDCVAYGLVFGTGAGLMAPRALASRAEVAAMIYRLSLLTTGGATGGGSTGGGVTATSYTITFMDGTEELGTVTTESNTSTEKAFTALGADAATKDGYVLVSWNTAADGSGEKYALNSAYTATGNMTLHAQWVKATDYIALAMQAAMDDFNNTYMDDVNRSYSDDDNNTAASVSVEKFAFNAAVDSGSDNNARTQTVTAKAAVDDNLAVEAIEKAATTVLGWLTTDETVGGGAGTGSGNVIDAIIGTIKDEFGISFSDATIDSIKTSVKNKLTGVGKNLWEHFYDDSGNYYTGDVTISTGPDASIVITVDQANHKTTYNGDVWEAARTLAVPLAKEMYASLKQDMMDPNKAVDADGYASVVKMSGTVTFTFTDNEDSIYKDDTAVCPHVYPVEINLTLDGGDLVSYKYVQGGSYEGNQDGKSFVKLNVTGDIQKAYTDQVNAVVNAALANETVKTELDNLIDGIIGDLGSDNETFSSLENVIESLDADPDEVFYGKFDEDGNKIEAGAIDEWREDNSLTAEKITGSNLYNKYWVEAEGAWDTYDNSALIEAVAKAVSDYVKAQAGEATWKMMAAGTEPDLLEQSLENFGIGTDFIGQIDAALKDYFLAVVCDVWREEAEKEEENFVNSDAAQQGKKVFDDEINKLVSDAIESSDYYHGLENVYRLKTLADMADVRLSNLATLLSDPTYSEIKDALLTVVGNRGSGLLGRLPNLVKQLPEGASVEINGVTLSTDDLKNYFGSANNLESVCDALADLINDHSGLQSLTLNSFAPAAGGGEDGMEITVRYNNRAFTFNLVIDIQ